MNRNKFSDDQWAVASQDERRCKRCAAPPPSAALDQVPAPPGAPGARKCNSCQLHLPSAAFSKKQRRKAPTWRCKLGGPTPPPPRRFRAAATAAAAPARMESIMTYYYVKRQYEMCVLESAC